MRPTLIVPILLGLLAGEAHALPSEFATGRTYYAEGEFRKAVAHFQLALKTNPDDAESYYWIGSSYRMLADIAAPFDRKYKSKARVNLTKAMDLAPSRLDYRRELFNFLVDSAGSSRAALRQAAAILRTLSESDPEYTYMHQRFEQESRANSSVDARLGRLFLAVPRAVYRIAELPASALSSRPEPVHPASASMR
jgi:tetratricopeptide (TPR) repeat protein